MEVNKTFVIKAFFLFWVAWKGLFIHLLLLLVKLLFIVGVKKLNLNKSRQKKNTYKFNNF